MLILKQEKFCQCIIKGMSQTDAYREGFDIKNIEIKEEDLKVIKEKLTQSLNKEAVFFINSFSRK